MFILASNSPRRRELIKNITDDFIAVNTNVDETLEEGIEPKEAVMYLAKIKSESVFDGITTVIGADTIVSKDNLILGKPTSKDDAKRMLHLLSNGTHSVFTGVNICTPKEEISFYSQTFVEFYDIEDLIDEYVNTDEPYDKAGAYAIQGKGSLFVKKIDGDYFNVVGLPVAKLNMVLLEHGLI